MTINLKWSMTGHYRGFLSWRAYLRGFKNLFKRNKLQYQMFPTSLSFDQIKEQQLTIALPKETKKIKTFFYNALDTIYYIPWNKVFKFIGIVGGVPLFIVVIYTSIIFILDKDKLMREEMQTLSQKYTHELEETYVLNKSKLDELTGKIAELEEKINMYIFKVPVYQRHQKIVFAQVMNKKKVNVIEIQQK